MSDLIASLIANGREERNLEYKQTMGWGDAKTKAKIVKSSLAMANLRDGGTIILGIERQFDDTYLPTGMAENDYNSFNQDDVSVEVNKYADPFVEVVVLKQMLQGQRFVVVQVREFEQLPILCNAMDWSDSARVRFMFGPGEKSKLWRFRAMLICERF